MKYHSLVFFAALLIASCSFSESSWISDAETSLLSHPSIRKLLANAVLQSRGSPQEIQTLINEANGNVEQIVNGINSLAQERVLRLDGDSVRVDSDGLRKALLKSFQAKLGASLPRNSPLATAIESGDSRLIAAKFSELGARVRRSLESRDLVGDILGGVTDALGSVVGGVTGAIGGAVTDLIGQQISSLISGLLDSVQNTLQGLLVTNAPGDAVGDFLAGILNFVIKGALQVIAIIQQTIAPSTSAQIAPLDFQFRERRDADIADVPQFINLPINL